MISNCNTEGLWSQWNSSTAKQLDFKIVMNNYAFLSKVSKVYIYMVEIMVIYWFYAHSQISLRLMN